MDDREREHPDEGTIHAWLDDALDDGAARAVAAHVEGCPACAERVAEARGLIAGASRIIGALDDVPSGTGPAWGRAPAAAPTPAGAAPARGWHLPRVTPARAAIAATVLVALGVSLTYERTAVESQASRAVVPMRAEAPAASPVAAAPPARDALLDSAVARNVAAAQPRREVEAAPGADVPVPAAPTPPGVVADAAAPTRVAAARATLRAQRDSGAGATADQLRGRVPAVVVAPPVAEERTVAAAVRADSVAFAPAGSAGQAKAAPAAQGRVLSVVAAGECYRVESANGVAAAWGTDALPLVVRVDSTRRSAAVLTVAGQGTGASAVVTPAGSDSLLLRLRRIGYEGTLALGAAGDTRAGVMRSRPLETQLEQVVTTATAPEPAPAATRRRAAPAAKAAAPSPAAQADARAAADAAPAVPIVARRIRCP